MASKNRKETSEGIEMDLAVSYLSRLVALRYLVPRFWKGKKTRVFIMGFPGANQPFKIDDFNSEKSYEGTMGIARMNTVIGNEALVLDSASKSEIDAKALFFGLNPGLIKTGIRDNVWSGGFFYRNVLGPIVEWLISLFSDSPESYAAKMVPLFFCTGARRP
jgi:hypothetical protein